MTTMRKLKEIDCTKWMTMRGVAVILCAGTLTWAFGDALVYTSVIQTTHGPVRGSEIEYGGMKIQAFRGIPYAAPPLGELRFKAPQPPAKWTTTRDATKYGSVCHQPLEIMWKLSRHPQMIMRYIWNLRNVLGIAYRMFTSSEDCLTLNVFTTQLGRNGLIPVPVLVYIHGGGFLVGDSTDTMYGPEYLLEKDIVVVTLNYRIGPLGFLATNSSHAPGNWGLKDQVAALKWVHQNIANFGGDPHQVTIYGASSGAASVQFHLMSPLSRGLFHKAISGSGSSACSWAVQKHPNRMSKLLAKNAGASPQEIEDPARRLEYLRKVDAKALIKATVTIMLNEDSEHGVQLTIPFAPVVEPRGTDGAFVTEDPKAALEDGRFARVPIMSGVNSLEGGILFMGFSELKSSNDLKYVDINVCNILPEDLKNAIMAKNDCQAVSKMILDVYFGGKPTSSSPLEFTHLFGDLVVGYPTVYAHAAHARYATKENPAYFYNFSYDGEWRLFKDMFGIELQGVLHGDDIEYVFRPKVLRLPDLPPTSPGYRTKERMLEFITNFVKYGNPSPTKTELIPISWEPSTGLNLNSMLISSDIKMEKIAIKGRLELWNNIYRKYLADSLIRQ